MLDNAVYWFGTVIENALAERVEVRMGARTESKPKYTLTRLLQESTKLPKPVEVEEHSNPWFPLMQWVGKRDGLVKRYAYVPPEVTEGTPKEDEDNG